MKKLLFAIILCVAALPADAGSDAVTPPVDLSQYGGILTRFYSVGLGLSAAGTTLATATPLTKAVNEITTVGSGSGVSIAPFNGPGVQPQEIINAGANALAVYPPVATAAIRVLNGSTAALAAGAASSLTVGSHATLECVSATLCYLGP